MIVVLDTSALQQDYAFQGPASSGLVLPDALIDNMWLIDTEFDGIKVDSAFESPNGSEDTTIVFEANVALEVGVAVDSLTAMQIRDRHPYLKFVEEADELFTARIPNLEVTVIVFADYSEAEKRWVSREWELGSWWPRRSLPGMLR